MSYELIGAGIVGAATIVAAWWANRRPQLVAYISGTASFLFTGSEQPDQASPEQDPQVNSELGEARADVPDRRPSTGLGPGGDTPFTVYVYTITIANQGRGVAEEIEISYPFLPAGFSITPQVRYEIETNPDGSQLVRIPSLGGNEQITIGHMYVRNWVVPSVIKSNTGRAQTIDVLPQRVWPTWLLNLLRVLVLIGLVYTLVVLFNLAGIIWDVLPTILP